LMVFIVGFGFLACASAAFAAWFAFCL